MEGNAVDAPVIFMSAGFTTVSASLFLTGIFGLVKLLSAIAFMFVFVKIRGNRFWLLLGSSLCGLCMLILAYFVSKIPGEPVSPEEGGLTLGGVISVLTVYVFAFSFSVSLGPISWNVCAEVCPPSLPLKTDSLTPTDIPTAHQRQVLRNHNMYAMAFPGAFPLLSSFPYNMVKGGDSDWLT